MDASFTIPVVLWHPGGWLFAGDRDYYPKGWYVLDDKLARPCIFSDDFETQDRLQYENGV